MEKKSAPKYLAAVDRKHQRVFVLAPPYLSALFADGEWQYVEPLSDEDIVHFELVTDPATIEKLVNQAKEAIFSGVESNPIVVKDEIN